LHQSLAKHGLGPASEIDFGEATMGKNEEGGVNAAAGDCDEDDDN